MNTTIDVHLSTCTLAIDVSNTPDVPHDALRDWIERRAATPIFNYLNYWQYTFALVSDPISLNGKLYALHATYGGNAYDIYNFTPQAATLAGDKLEKLTLHVQNQ